MLLLFGVVLFLVGVVGITSNRKTIFDVGSRAWTGLGINLENFRDQFNRAPTRKAGSNEGFLETKKLFDSLSKTYFDAEVQNINIPEFGVRGAAFLKYDVDLDKTFIFTSVENFPIPQNQVIRLWLTRDGQVFLPVGILDYSFGEKGLIGYSVFVRPGDIRNYKELVFSYDPVEKINKPARVVLSVLF